MSLIKRALNRGLGFTGGGSGDAFNIPTNGSLGYSSAGVEVTERTALQLLTVLACVRVISENLSGMPIDAVATMDGTRRVLDPSPAICTDPFGGRNAIAEGLTLQEGIAQLAVSALLRGNGYAAVMSFDQVTGMPERLRVLAPDRVTVQTNGRDEKAFSLDGKPFPRGRMLHVTGMCLPGEVTGVSVISYARRTIGLGIAAEEFGAQFFGRGAHMSGVLELESDLKPEKARELKENFESKHSGLSNSHAVGVLTGGAKFKPISITPEDAQFLGTREAQSLDIAMLFGVPPHMISKVTKSTSWGSGIEAQTLGFQRFTLQPWAKRFEDKWSAMLPEPYEAKFNFRELLRPDTATRFASYLTARTVGIFTPNEIRGFEGMAPLDGGDDLFSVLNYIAPAAEPASETEEPAEESAEDEPAPDDEDDAEKEEA